ncbi:LytTR family DNA-binding domain-containing protein [Marinilongibacter aquaticus]|uniref:LytR/AlgR family response regulator transcription factor n=1 Tax=Marinilongibacter aquaticus TaxID=2975157 RepID=UPI0021BD1319|nr:LytTR family DNA-binding domain-containing protein [Marinilongibacter aquaticus]UBM59846.1 LytTR family DNA-binding domain-containing protein [Marinilongibacter aquaticus]
MSKVILIDDEPKAIESLKWEIDNFCPDIEVVQTFVDPRKALKYFENHPDEIDCLFLDIEMPQMDGFRFLDELSQRNFAVIITTAYDQYGINAIKERALDYLLKPIDSDDLIAACEKLEEYKREHRLKDKFEETLMSAMANTTMGHRRIGLNIDGKIVFLKPDEVLYCEGDGNYTSVFLENGEKFFVTQTLKKMEERLQGDEFFRIHNSYIINLTKVREYIKNDALVIMTDGRNIPVSRNKKSDFLGKF